jgi:DNA-binding CsgD family transcriptional regulator
VDEAMVDRASRITPQEWRVIALAIEGVAPSQACEALGIALGTLESHKQAIRRKLGIPKGVRFEAYVRENFGEGVPLPEQKAGGQGREPRVVDKATQDRRVRWLLRITLQELSEVSVSAGLRAQLLEQTAQRMNPSAMEEASREVEDLQQIAKEAQALFDKVLADIRARGAEPGSVGQ